MKAIKKVSIFEIIFYTLIDACIVLTLLCAFIFFSNIPKRSSIEASSYYRYEGQPIPLENIPNSDQFLHVSQNMQIETLQSQNNVITVAHQQLQATPIYTKEYVEKQYYVKQLTQFVSNSKAAKSLSTLIIEAADNHELNYSIAFTLVHVESDFTVRASNKYSGARGLCQVTKPCLREYNNWHKKKYSFDDMFDAEKNLEVGFWYFSRILNHYSSFPNFGITTSNEQSLFRDAYIIYNIGIYEFKRIGQAGRNKLRSGVVPAKFSYAPKGTRYDPYYRYIEKLQIWQQSN